MRKKMIIYGVGIFVSKILVFVMVPIYTRVFSTSDYGYYDVILSDIQMLAGITFVEIWSGIIRFMFDYEDTYKPIKIMMKLSPFLITAYVITLFALGNFVSLRYPILNFIYGITYVLFYVSNSICRGLQNNIDYVVSGFISTLLSCLLSILFCVILKFDISFLFVAQIVAYTVAILYVEFRTSAFRHSLKSIVEKNDIKDMLLYCFPLMLNAISYTFLGTYNKNVLLNLFGESISGLYAFSSKFSSVASVLISIYALSWQEEAYSLSKNDNRDDTYTMHLNNYFKIIGLAIPIYSIICYFFVPIIGGKEYSAAIRFVPTAIISAFIANASGIISTLLAVQKRTSQLFLSTVVGAIVNVSLMSFLPHIIGDMSSNISLCIANTVIAVWRYLMSKKTMNINISYLWVLIFIIESILVISVYYMDNNVISALVLILVLMVWIISNIQYIKSTIDTVYLKIKRR